jgi:hypothetical protein
MATKDKSEHSSREHYTRKVAPELSSAPWLLRVTDHKEKPSPVFIIKERILPDQRTDTADLKAPRSVMKERGLLYGPQQLRCLPVVRAVVARVCNKAGIPLELHQYLSAKRISFRGNLPLDAEAGCKLALIFRLQERIKEMDRVELLARRIDRFTREEASYWFSRISTFGEAANRWAMAGMKVMLAGQPGDPGIEPMLNQLRTRH